MDRGDTPEILLTRKRFLAKHDFEVGSYVFWEGARREIIKIGKDYTLSIKAMAGRATYVDPLDILK